MEYKRVQLNLNNPVTNGPVVLGCNKEVAVLQMTSIKWLHLFLAQTHLFSPSDSGYNTKFSKLYSGHDWVAVILIIEVTA